jgi:hypothetical protein
MKIGKGIMLMISTYTLYVEVIFIAILYLGKHYTKGPLIKNKKFNLLCSNFVSLQIEAASSPPWESERAWEHLHGYH